jgi:biotin carboxyl carrier protein
MNEIRAHKDGSVTKVHVAAGAAVESGSPLLTIA